MDLFERIETFFKRLESYAGVPPSPAMTDTIVKIMIEVLDILAIATNEVKQRRPSQLMICNGWGPGLIFIREIFKEANRQERYRGGAEETR